MITTRFPPSPTGLFHIGSARTALFNYLFSQGKGGSMLLRFEDTDKERSKREYEEDILAGLEWLGLHFTLPEVSRQSERTEIYNAYIPKLVAAGKAYEAEESKDGTGNVIRFKNPGSTVQWNDLVRGDVVFETGELGDFVIAKNIQEPLYHLAVVIDDHEMGVTHVIRGEDHISNTPRQFLILEALGFERPAYAHIPLILAPDRSKLSKRHGATSVNEYRAQGFLASALVNYLALLGWNPGGDTEIFTLDELVTLFDIEKIQKGGAIFDIEKLRWFNREHLLKLPENEFLTEAISRLREAIEQRSFPWNQDIGTRVVPLLRERISVWSDIAQMVQERELDFFFTNPAPEPSRIPQKNSDAETASKHLMKVHELFSSLSDESFLNPERLKDTVWEYATTEGRGAVLWPLRYTLSGKERSPDPFSIASVIGKEATLARIQAGRSLLGL